MLPTPPRADDADGPRMKHGLLDPASLASLICDTLDQSDDIVLVLKQPGGEDGNTIVIAAANDAFRRASGYALDEIVGRPLFAVTPDDADSGRFQELASAIRDSRSCRSQLLCARRDGTRFWFGYHLMPVRNAVPPTFVALGCDITEPLREREQQAAVQGLLAKVFLCVQVSVAIARCETGRTRSFCCRWAWTSSRLFLVVIRRPRP